MCAWIVPPIADLIEPAIAPEFYVDNIGGIELTHGCIRILLYAEQMPLEAGSAEPGKIVQCKLIGPLSSVPQAIGQLAQCLWRPVTAVIPPAPPGGFLPRLVR